MQTYQFEPKFIVDISDTFEVKMKSVYAYGTQFYNPESKEFKMNISFALKRLKEMKPEDAESYLRWRTENATPEVCEALQCLELG